MLIGVDIRGKDLANGEEGYCLDATKIGIYFDWLFMLTLMLCVLGFVVYFYMLLVRGWGYLSRPQI